MNDPEISYDASSRTPWRVNGLHALRKYAHYCFRRLGFSHAETKILMETEKAIGEAEAIIAEQRAKIAEPLVFRVLGRDFEVPFNAGQSK